MKCPCCKYEQKNAKSGYVDVEKVVKSGKTKGQVKVVKEWGIIQQPVGDEEFESIKLIALNTFGNSYDQDLNICPK